MFVGDERQPVVTGGLERLVQCLKHQFIGPLLGAEPRILRLRSINPQLVVFDIVAVNLNGCLKLAVAQRVVMQRQRADHFVAHPFTQARKAIQPAVVVLAGGGRHQGRHLVPLGGGGIKSVVERGFQRDKQRRNVACIQ
ncbi:hypothetical protein D3C72_1474250 [compost metagenome]